MKITTARLKQIIKEETESDDRLLDAIRDLADRSSSDPDLVRAIKKLSAGLDDLDLSVDFLSAAMLDVDPLSIAGAQSALGRAASPAKRRPPPPKEDQPPPPGVEEIIRQELEALLNEKSKETVREEIDSSLSEGATLKIPVERYEDFKRRLEKWAMHYEKISSWISNDAILQPTDEQLENPGQLSRITREDGTKIRRTLFKLDSVLIKLMGDFDMTFKTYQDERYKALKQLDLDEELEKMLSEEGEDDWIGKATDPDHKGDCTPMTKSTCTPPRKALAKRFKKAAKKKDKEGGTGWQGKV